MNRAAAPACRVDPCRVRRMSIDDVDGVARLFLAEAEYHQQIDSYFELEPAFDWPSYVRGLLAKEDRHVGVADLDGEPVAFLYARFARVAARLPARRSRLDRLLRRAPSPGRPATPFRPRAWGVVEQCWVAEEHRRQGLAGQLLEAAVDWLRQRGATRVELGVSAQNPAAQELWRRHGFELFRLSMSLPLDEAAS